MLARLRFPSCPTTPVRKDADRRASVAALFREDAGEEQILFIRRAVNPKDTWSGHVALPGGRQDAADRGCDEATAVREVREEVGIDLATGLQFHHQIMRPLSG